MHPYLNRLGVRPEVQEFFSPFYDSNATGDLCFPYNPEFEHYGFGFHQVPSSGGCWLAGNLCFDQVAQLVVCSSAMEAVAWLNCKLDGEGDSFSMLFFSAGASVSNEQLIMLRNHFSRKRIIMVLGNDLLGRLSAVKLAAALRGQKLQICYLAEEKVQILFRGRTCLFNLENLSLNALEKLSGFRFRVIISTPKNYNSFFEQLKAAVGLSF